MPPYADVLRWEHLPFDTGNRIDVDRRRDMAQWMQTHLTRLQQDPDIWVTAEPQE